jgi:hypothetical protein
MRYVHYIMVVFFALTVGCRSRQKGSTASAKTSNSAASEQTHELSPLSIGCELKNRVSYSLNVNLDRRGFDLLVKTLLTKSYVGFWKGSQINQGQSYAERIELRAKEIATLSECLTNQSEAGAPNVPLPKDVANYTVPLAEVAAPVLASRDEGGSANLERHILSQFDLVDSAATAQDWRVTYIGLGTLKSDLDAARVHSLLPSQKLDQFLKRMDLTRSRLVKSGVLMCPGQFSLSENPGDLPQVDVRFLRNLASHSCFLWTSSVPQDSLRLWTAVTSLLMPQAASLVYGGAIGAKSAAEMRAVFVKALELQSKSGLLKSLVEDVAKLRHADGVSRQVVQAFLKGRLLSAFPEFFAVNSDMQDQMPAVLTDYL